MTIRPATREDLPGITRLLEGAGLPTEDLPPHGDGFFVSLAGDSLVGVVGLERFGEVGLLRSLAVDPRLRGRGSGRALCEILQGIDHRKTGKATTAQHYTGQAR